MCAERLLLRSAATDYTHIYTVNSIQTGKCLGKNQRRKLFECKVIKGHSILYRQPMRLKFKIDYHESTETVLN